MDEFFEFRHRGTNTWVVGRPVGRASSNLYFRAEIGPRLANEIREISKFVVRILSGVTADDERDTPTNEFVTTGVLEVTAVREIPMTTPGSVETREKLVQSDKSGPAERG